MALVLGKAAAFIAFIALGYGLKRSGYFRAEDFYVLSRIVIRITLPAAIVSNFSKISMDASLLVMCVLGILVNVVMVGVGYLMYAGKGRQKQVFGMLNVSGFNIGNFTMPFVQSFLGPVGFAVTSLFDAGNSVMCTGGTISAATAVAGEKGKVSLKGAVKSLFSSLPFDAYILMTALSLAGVKLPQAVLMFADTAGGANAFLALLMIGIGFEMRGDRQKNWEIAKILTARYGMALVFSLLFYYCSPFSLEIRKTLAIVVWGPVSSVAPIYTGALKGDVELSSAVNSISIIISIAAITCGLILLA